MSDDLATGEGAVERAPLPTADVMRLADGRELRRNAVGQAFMEGKYRDGGYENAERVVGAWAHIESGLTVIASTDQTPHGQLLHVSVAYPDRWPSWGDMVLVRDKFYPATIDVMMMLPRQDKRPREQPWTFHLFEVPVPWGMT